MKKTATAPTTAAEKNASRQAAALATLQATTAAAEDILQKGEAMTAADRLRLLQFVNVSYHKDRKIQGIYSIDSCATCTFCRQMIDCASRDPLMICGMCYADAALWQKGVLYRHSLNARIFSAVLFTVDELKMLQMPPVGIVRFNSDGDTVNVTMGRNYLRIVSAFPCCQFSYFFKNSPAVSAALAEEGYKTRADLPRNLRFIQSSIRIGIPAEPVWYADAVFTVYPDAETTAAAVAAGSFACNGKKCMECGFHCYMMQRPEKPVQVAELLRASKAKRAAVLAAYRAYMLA